METIVKTSESGEVIYQIPVEMQARFIIGVMLSFFALFFGYYLITGLIEYVRVASASEWLAATPGFLVVLVIFLAFAVPTYAILIGQSKVIVNRDTGRIIDMFDLRIYQQKKVYCIDQVKSVSIGEKTFRTKGHSSHSYAVQILMDDQKRVTAGYEKDIAEARKLAEYVSNSLGYSTAKISEM